MLRPFLFALAVSLPAALLPLAVSAQANPHIRGTVASVEGDTVTIDTTAGESVAVEMAPDYTVMVYSAIEPADLAAGDFLSIPSVPDGEGRKIALSINVFPEAMRGTGEGTRPWDLSEDSLMTNATIGTVAANDDGNTLTVTHGDVSEEIVVPEAAPITRFAPDPERRLAVGDMTVVFARAEGDTLQGRLAGVMADGTLPPL